jgi:hypothetical protein
MRTPRAQKSTPSALFDTPAPAIVRPAACINRFSRGFFVLHEDIGSHILDYAVCFEAIRALFG